MGIARRGMLAALPAVLAAPRLASAQGFPSRPIRIVIPFTPAGTTDLVGRLTAEMLGRRLNHQVVVDNRPGASGNVGAEFVARSEAVKHMTRPSVRRSPRLRASTSSQRAIASSTGVGP